MKHTMVNRKKKKKNPQQKEQIINRIVLAKSYIMYMKFHIYIYNVEQRDDSNMHMPQIEFQFGKLFSV